MQLPWRKGVVIEGPRIKALRRMPRGQRMAMRSLRLFPRASLFACYLGLSLAFFGIPVLGHFNTRFVGSGGDVGMFLWFFNWWPYAVGHGLDPFTPKMIWSPTGVNLAWTTSIPGLSLLLAPVTLTLGPVVAYNVVAMFAPPLNAACAALLVRQLTGSRLGACIGGYLFGFSTYVIGQMLGHFQLSVVFTVPLLGYCLTRAYQEHWRPWKTSLVTGVIAAFQFSVGAEIFATFAMFAGAGWLLAMLAIPGERQRLGKLALGLVGGYAVSAALVSPVLVHMLRGGQPLQPVADPAFYSTNLLNYFIPTTITLLGGHVFAPISSQFTGNIAENGAYLGLPLLLTLGLALRRAWPSRWGKVLTLLTALVVVASLGPVLHLSGKVLIPLPWSLVSRVPLLEDALPVRFVMYVWLLAAIAVGYWLSVTGPRRRHGRLLMVAVACVALLPTWQDADRPWWGAVHDITDSFFVSASHAYLRPGENVVILPFGEAGNGMPDQVFSGMAFTMPEGYVLPKPPREFLQWNFVGQFQNGDYNVGAEGVDEFRAYLGMYQVEAVLVTMPAPGGLKALLDQVGLPAPVQVEGVLLYQVPQQWWSDSQLSRGVGPVWTGDQGAGER